MEIAPLMYAAASTLVMVLVTTFGTKKIINFGQSLRKTGGGIGGSAVILIALGALLTVILVLPLGIVLGLKYSGLVENNPTALGIVYFTSVLGAIFAAYYSSRSRN